MKAEETEEGKDKNILKAEETERKDGDKLANNEGDGKADERKETTDNKLSVCVKTKYLKTLAGLC